MYAQKNNSTTPAVCVYQDEEECNIEVKLPGIDKEDIDFQMSENWFCLEASKEGESYFGCWILAAYDINPEEAKARFENDLLSITVPLEEMVSEGMKISIE